jgi:hypothetical protein
MHQCGFGRATNSDDDLTVSNTFTSLGSSASTCSKHGTAPHAHMHARSSHAYSLL